MASALFSSTQLRVLGLLFGQPDRSFFASEIIEHVGTGSGAVQRQLKRLADSGLVRVFPVGRQTHYQANPDAPIFDELCALMRKTVGLAQPLREAFEPLRDELVLALVFGSVAKKTDTARSDIDLLLVSDTLTLEEVFRALEPAEHELGRSVQPTMYTRAEFERQRSKAFLSRVLAGDVIVLIGEIPDVDSSTR